MIEWTAWHQRHEAKIELIAGVDCWVWVGAYSGNYGKVSYHQESTFAHRAAFIEAGGTFSEGPMVRHLCGNSFCVRPGHLKAGTSAQNARDAAEMFTIGRSKLGRHDVLDIRAAYNRGEALTDIAKRHGIAAGTVYPIVMGRAYKFVDADNLPKPAQRSPRKLDAAKVAAIRDMLRSSQLPQSKIAEQFGVRQGTISRINTGIRWANP